MWVVFDNHRIICVGRGRSKLSPGAIQYLAPNAMCDCKRVCGGNTSQLRCDGAGYQSLKIEARSRKYRSGRYTFSQELESVGLEPRQALRCTPLLNNLCHPLR